MNMSSRQTGELRELVINANSKLITHGFQVLLEGEFGDHNIFDRGALHLIRHRRLVLPMCLNNGYYNRGNIAKLMIAASAISERVFVFFTDGPAIHNYLAYGKDETFARRESRKQFNRLRNCCEEALRTIPGEAKKFDFDSLRWEKIYQWTYWQEQRDYLAELLTESEEFNRDVRDTTKSVLSKRLGIEGKVDNLESRIDIAVMYTIEELAFLLAASRRIGEVEENEPALGQVTDEQAPFCYVYYEHWPVMERLIDGRYDGVSRETIGYLIMTLSEHKQG